MILLPALNKSKYSEEKAEDFEAKVEVLRKAFFHLTLEANLDDLEGTL